MEAWTKVVDVEIFEMNEFETYFRGEINRSWDDLKGSRDVGREKGQKWLRHLRVIHSLIQYMLGSIVCSNAIYC